jgi:hypothetical protein
MWLLLGQIFSFVLLVGTFIYVRSCGAIVRSIVPRSLASETGLLLRTVFYVGPTAIAGAVLYLANTRGDVIWISLTGVYLSWGQDLLYTLAMLYYFFVLRRIRRRPASFESIIRLQDYAAWPSSEVVRRPLDYLVPRLPFAKGWKKTTVLIGPADFERYLLGDTRLVDEAELGTIAIPYLDFCAVPHFPLPSLKFSGHLESDDTPGTNSTADSLPNENEEVPIYYERPVEYVRKFVAENFLAEHTPELARKRHEWAKKVGVQKREVEAAAVRFYLVNRALHAELSEELWTTSCRICRTLPGVIARSWKAFHFQESVRLRYLALFNTVDQLLRMLGALIFCRIRDGGLLVDGKLAGKEFRVPASILGWSKTIELALRIDCAGLEEIRNVLLKPRAEFAEWEERFKPFSAVIGGPVGLLPAHRHLLGGLTLLFVLRNKIIGHGGIGSRLNMRPLRYLSTVHHFFLSLMPEILDLNIELFAGTDPKGETSFPDQGTTGMLKLRGEHFPLLKLGDITSVMHPYLYYRNGKLLILNRMTRDSVSFVDFEVNNSFEPSFLTLKIDSNDFLKPFDGMSNFTT